MRRIHLALVFLAVLALMAPAATADSKGAALMAKLKQLRLKNVDFKEQPLTGVVKWLRVATGLNFHIKRAVLAKAGIELEDIVVTAKLADVKVSTFLGIVLEEHELGVKVKGNVVYITTKKDTYGKPISKMYTISHITWTKMDFIGPEIDLRPSGASFDDEYEPERIVEDDPLDNGDAVIELIKEITGSSLWDENDDWSLSGTDKYIVVKAPKSMQTKVNKALVAIASMK